MFSQYDLPSCSLFFHFGSLSRFRFQSFPPQPPLQLSQAPQPQAMAGMTTYDYKIYK